MWCPRDLQRRWLWLKLLIALLCSAVFFAGTYTFASAYTRQSGAGQPAFSLRPAVADPSNPATAAYFILTAAQGKLVQEAVRVTNVGTATGNVRLFPVDVTTGQTGGIIYLDQAQHDVGSWIRLDRQELTLSPGQSQVVHLQIAVPRDGRPGQHIGGIIAQNETLRSSTSLLGQAHLQIKIQQQTAIAVELTLPGPQTEQLAATGIQAGGSKGFQQLLVGLQNTGTLLIDASGSLQVSDTQGHLLQNLAIQVGTFLPQTSISYPASVQGKALGVGTYQAVLTLHYGRQKTFDQMLYYTTTFTITQQQLRQVFPNNSPPAPFANSFLPLWASILIAVLALLVVGGASGLLFWWLGMRTAKGSRRRRQGEHRQKRTEQETGEPPREAVKEGKRIEKFGGAQQAVPPRMRKGRQLRKVHLEKFGDAQQAVPVQHHSRAEGTAGVNVGMKRRILLRSQDEKALKREPPARQRFSNGNPRSPTDEAG